MSKELIHIMTDASFCHMTKKASCGFSIKSAVGVLRGSREISAIDSFEAELRAVSQALDIAERCDQLSANAVLLIKSDNRGVINYLNGGLVKRADLQCVLDSIFKITKRFNLKIQGQYVQGHSDKPNKKYVLQRYCDQLARTQLREVKLGAVFS